MAYTSKNIQILKGLDPVRKRPGMYIGNTGIYGLCHLIVEITDNSIDEHLAGYCDELRVTLCEDGCAIVSDNGRGIPVDLHPTEKIAGERVIFTTLHAGGKFNDASYKISGGLHGVGSSVVNALSKKLLVEVYKDGYRYTDSYEYGVPTTKLINGFLPKEKIKDKSRHGTCVTIYPDETIFTETTRFKASIIRQRLKEASYLNPNLKIYFENKRDHKEVELFHNPRGLLGFMDDITQNEPKLSPSVLVAGEKDGIFAEICMTMCDNTEENYYCFTNGIANPDGGTHLSSFKSSFAKLINTYCRNELGLLKDKDANLNGSDIRAGLCCIISIKHPDPQFEGQTKTKLSNQDVVTALSTIVTEQFTLYFDRNFAVLQQLCDRALLLAKKKSMEKNKVNLSRFSFDGNGKLAKQESSDAQQCEIFIVEGDSAGGSAKSARNRKYQAVLPLRGKILNVEKQSTDKVLENAEIKAMINAFGCGFGEGYGNDFDIGKLNYGKIIIMTDADVDGAHIATLLLTFFFRFYPDLIREGHVYIANAPLYRVGQGKQIKYLYSDEELAKYRKSHPGNFAIQRYKGLGEMDKEQLYETTMNPDNRLLTKVCLSNLVEANHITQTLMGTDVAPRRAYIEENGQYASLDI